MEENTYPPNLPDAQAGSPDTSVPGKAEKNPTGIEPETGQIDVEAETVPMSRIPEKGQTDIEPETGVPEPDVVPKAPPAEQPARAFVSLSCPREGVAITYTLNGDEPDEYWQYYEGTPLCLQEGKMLKAEIHTVKDSAGSDLQSGAGIPSKPDPEPDVGPPQQEVSEEPPAVRAVDISPDSGTHRLVVEVFLSCPTEGAAIHYTLDDNEPNETSSRYDPEEGLFLRDSRTLKARAYKEGHVPSIVSQAEYDILTPTWREKEPEDRADEVAHETRDEAQYGEWRLAGASVRGKLHAHNALWRDDAFAFGRREGWTVIAVCDGAGSAPLSRVGARLACEYAVKNMEESLEDFVLTSEDQAGLEASEMPKLQIFLAGAAKRALAAIDQEAALRRRPPEEFAATLMVVAHYPWREQALVGALQVGDGSIALLDGNLKVTLLGEADHGEHSSETRFLTTQGVARTFLNRGRFFSVKDDLRAIAVMTDGVSDDFFPEEERMVELFLGEDLPGMTGRDGHPVRGALRAVRGAEDSAAALAEWVRYEKRGSSDDRTLVLFWSEE